MCRIAILVHVYQGSIGGEFFIGLWNLMCAIVMYVHALVLMEKTLKYVISKTLESLNFYTRLKEWQVARIFV